jgi:hypothetical protein
MSKRPFAAKDLESLKARVVHAGVNRAVIVPAEGVRALPKTIDFAARREKVILDRARSAGFNGPGMSEARSASDEIH